MSNEAAVTTKEFSDPNTLEQIRIAAQRVRASAEDIRDLPGSVFTSGALARISDDLHRLSRELAREAERFG